MAQEPMMVEKEYRKADSAIKIIDKRATDTIRNLISDIKNHTLILQALLLEFDDSIPVAEDGVAKALNDLRDAMKDVEE